MLRNAITLSLLAALSLLSLMRAVSAVSFESNAALIEQTCAAVQAEEKALKDECRNKLSTAGETEKSLKKQIDALTKSSEEFKKSSEEFKKSSEEFKKSSEEFKKTSEWQTARIAGLAKPIVDQKTCSKDSKDKPKLHAIEPRPIPTESPGNYAIAGKNAANVKQLEGVTIMKDIIYLLNQVSVGKDAEKLVISFINLDKNTRRAQKDIDDIAGKQIRSCEDKGPKETVYSLFIMGVYNAKKTEDTIFKVDGNFFYQQSDSFLKKHFQLLPFIQLSKVPFLSWSLTPDCRVAVVTKNNQLITYNAAGTQEGHPLPLPTGTQYAQAIASGGYLVSNVNGGNSRILLLNAAGQELFSYGGASGNEEQQLNNPMKILTDRYGRLIVLDSGNNRVVMIECDLSRGRILQLPLLTPELPATLQILDIAYAAAAEKLVVITNEKNATGFPTGLKEYSITVPAGP